MWKTIPGLSGMNNCFQWCWYQVEEDSCWCWPLFVTTPIEALSDKIHEMVIFGMDTDLLVMQIHPCIEHIYTMSIVHLWQCIR